MKNSQILCVNLSPFINQLSLSYLHFLVNIAVSLKIPKRVKDFTVVCRPVLPLSLLVGGSSNFFSQLLKIYLSSNIDVISLERIHLVSWSLSIFFQLNDHISHQELTVLYYAHRYVFFYLWNTWKLFPCHLENSCCLLWMVTCHDWIRCRISIVLVFSRS